MWSQNLLGIYQEKSQEYCLLPREEPLIIASYVLHVYSVYDAYSGSTSNILPMTRTGLLSVQRRKSYFRESANKTTQFYTVGRSHRCES